MWKTHFARKQFRNHSYPECQHKHNIRKAHLMRIRQLIRLATDFVNVESKREYYGRQTEKHHCKETKKTVQIKFIVMLEHWFNRNVLAVKPTHRAYGITSRSQLLDASKMIAVVMQMQPTNMQIKANSHSGCNSGVKQTCGRLYSVMHVHIKPSRVSPAF